MTDRPTLRATVERLHAHRQACAPIFAATYILLDLTADVIGIISNPRLLHPR